MPPKTPEFWYRAPNAPTSLLESGLSLLCPIYHLGYKINTCTHAPRKAPIPVLCIGNITAGGSGKTPTAIALYHLIKKHSLFTNLCFITRGYGGSIKETRVITVHDTPDETGDEPHILLKHCKTIISMNRYDGAKMAHDLGHDLVILDDGFQNNSIQKDFSILVIDGATGFGNQKLLPAGPLREPIPNALSRADAIIMIGEDKHNIEHEILQHYNIQVLKAKLPPSGDLPDKATAYTAFAGLAHPQKFHNTLKNNGYNIKSFIPFPDHHPFNKRDLDMLEHMANESNTTLITTEKDHIRLPENFKPRVEVLSIELALDNESTLLTLLREKLHQYIEKR